MYKKSRQTWMKHLDFTVWDLVMVAIAYILSHFIRYGFHMSVFARSNMIMDCLILLLIYFFVAMFGSAYKNILRRDRYQEAKAVIIQTILTFFIFVLFMYFTKQAFSRAVMFQAGAYSTIIIYAERILWKRIIRLHMLDNEKLPHLMIIADKKTVTRCIQTMRKRRYNYFYILGVCVIDHNMKGEEILGYPVLCNASEIRKYVLGEVVDEVFLSMENEKETMRLTQYFLEMGVSVHISLIRSGGDDLPNRVVERMGGHYVLTTSNNTTTGIPLLIKRATDILGGLVGLGCTGILYLYIAPRIKKADPGPVFFSQERVGKNGRRFKIYKFRSMYMDAEERKKELMAHNEMNGLMFKMENDPRILPGIGHKIRDTSMDEFPQFLNVLKGEMSLVGTRPPTVSEFKQYDPHHKMRLSFKPGLTGIWQVSGRSNITDFEKIVKLDNEYIKNWSLGLDVRIILKTIKVVFKKEGSK